jgi:hypothetical protein
MFVPPFVARLPFFAQHYPDLAGFSVSLGRCW